MPADPQHALAVLRSDSGGVAWLAGLTQLRTLHLNVLLCTGTLQSMLQPNCSLTRIRRLCLLTITHHNKQSSVCSTQPRNDWTCHRDPVVRTRSVGSPCNKPGSLQAPGGSTSRQLCVCRAGKQVNTQAAAVLAVVSHMPRLHTLELASSSSQYLPSFRDLERCRAPQARALPS